MGLLFNNWAEPGYYEDDGYGGYSRVSSLEKIFEAYKKGELFHHDGMSMTKVNNALEIKNIVDDTTL